MICLDFFVYPKYLLYFCNAQNRGIALILYLTFNI